MNLMADLDDDATPELSFTYQVRDEVVQEALAVGRELRQTRELAETLMAHPAAAVGPVHLANRRRGRKVVV